MQKPAVLFLAIFALATYAFIAIPATAGNPQPAPPPVSHAAVANPVTPTAASRAHAKVLYNMDCAMCHNNNGDGKTDIANSMKITLPDFTNPATLANLSDGKIFDLIRYGSGTGNTAMPPETSDRAPDADVWNLVLYLRTLAKH